MKKILTLMTTTALISLTIPTISNLISSNTTNQQLQKNKEKNIQIIKNINNLQKKYSITNLGTSKGKNNLKDSGKNEFYGYIVYDYIYLSHDTTTKLNYAVKQDMSSFIQALEDALPGVAGEIASGIGWILYGEWIAFNVAAKNHGSGVEIQALATDDIPYLITSVSPQ